MSLLKREVNDNPLRRRLNDNYRLFRSEHPDLCAVCALDHRLQRQGVLATIEEQVHFARRRFGRYEVIDFVAVLFGYAVSGERTLEAFYERLDPWADAFMA